MNLEAEFCPESQGSEKAGCRQASEGPGTEATNCLHCVSPVGQAVGHGCEAHVRRLLSLYLLHLVLITVSVQTLLGLHIPTADEPCSPLKAALGVNAERHTIHEKCAHAEHTHCIDTHCLLPYANKCAPHQSLCPLRGITGLSEDRSYRKIPQRQVH